MDFQRWAAKSGENWWRTGEKGTFSEKQMSNCTYLWPHVSSSSDREIIRLIEGITVNTGRTGLQLLVPTTGGGYLTKPDHGLEPFTPHEGQISLCCSALTHQTGISQSHFQLFLTFSWCMSKKPYQATTCLSHTNYTSPHSTRMEGHFEYDGMNIYIWS